jgi:hypothetical protein
MATELGVEAKVHLLANLAAFVPPRYPSLPAASLTALLHLMARIMSTLPPMALEPPSAVSNRKQVAIAESDSDSDSEDLAHGSASVSNPVPLPRLDERTLKRLQTLPSPTHISSIVRATQSHDPARIALCDFFFALCTVWPSRADPVLSTVVVSTNGGLVRELYRGYVRGSPLGGDDSLATLQGTYALRSHIDRDLMTPCRRRTCKYLAPFAFLDGLVHAFTPYHGRRRVFLRSRHIDASQRSPQPAHAGRNHVSITEILEHRLYALLARRPDRRIQRRLCARPQHQMGQRAAKTNAVPTSRAYAGVS